MTFICITVNHGTTMFVDTIEMMAFPACVIAQAKLTADVKCHTHMTAFMKGLES